MTSCWFKYAIEIDMIQIQPGRIIVLMRIDTKLTVRDGAGSFVQSS